MKAPILVVDDDEGILESCRMILEDEGHSVEVAHSGAAGLEILRQRSFALMLIDLRMPEMSGLEILEQARAADPDVLPIIITGYGTIESAVEAMKKGAFNYITKPFTAAQLMAAVDTALEYSTLLRDNASLREQLKRCCSLHRIVGQSASLESVLAIIAKVAPSDANVLVTGESGTGKELVAHTLHVNSNRCDKPFIAVDCAALPSTLLESELFGYEQGAFTGASQMKRGLFELADRGTLLLDEIAEMSAELQAKLLRTLQERSFRRLGGERLIRVDIRIIASTNRNLQAEVQDGRFRQDLLYRLNVVTINPPPLRDRQGDVARLTDYFLREFSRASGKSRVRIDPEALRALDRYRWPGNVRELRNVIERAVVLCEGDTVRVQDLPEDIQEQGRIGKQIPLATGYKTLHQQWLGYQGKQYLMGLLRQHHGNISAVAREAQLSRKSVYDLLRRFEIDPLQFHTQS